MWYEIFGRSVSRRMLSPVSDSLCDVDMTVRTLAGSGARSRVYDGVCVQHMMFTGGVWARRTPELLSDGNDDIVLHLHETGRRVVSQLGRDATIGPGGGLLTSNADISTIVMPGPARFVCVGVPRKHMTTLVPGLEDALMRSLPPDAGVLRLLMRYLDVLEDEQALSTFDVQRAVATHIHDLCTLAIGTTREMGEIAKGRGLRAARLRAIKADIVGSLGDDNLSAAALAPRHGVTPRYIHKLFEGEGTTFSRFVLGLRLECVHRALTDPRYANLTICAIAYDAGFGDLSTFNRAFRRHFGATPSDIRAAGQR